MKLISIVFLTTLFSVTASFGQTKKDSLLVFVGEKIEVKEYPEENDGIRIDTIINGNDTTYRSRFSMDSRYVAKYKILQWLNGSYDKDTIEFIVYDHYGTPGFSKFKTVLLFVSYYEGKLYHEKYQYFSLYLTTDNKWASPYSSSDYSHPFKDSITVKPEKIQFKEKVTFNVARLSPDQLYTWFPLPYYEIKNGKAIAIYGNYIEDLFKLKQETILKARGIY